MRKLSDIYGYGTPSNRYVRPQSQRTENYGDPIEREEALDQVDPFRHELEAEKSMAKAILYESEYEQPTEEYNSKPWRQ